MLCIKLKTYSTLVLLLSIGAVGSAGTNSLAQVQSGTDGYFQPANQDYQIPKKKKEVDGLPKFKIPDAIKKSSSTVPPFQPNPKPNLPKNGPALNYPVPANSAAKSGSDPAPSVRERGGYSLTRDGSTPPDQTMNRQASAISRGTSGFSVPGIEEPKPTEDENFFEPTRLLANVGGEPIFVGDIIGDINLEIETRIAQAPDFIKIQQRKVLLKQMLVMAIEQKLIYVDMLNTLPDPAAVDSIRDQVAGEFEKAQLPRMMEALKVESRDALDFRLRMLGSSLRQNKKSWVDSQLVAIFVHQMIQKKPKVEREELIKYYREHQSDFAVKAKVRWEQIMVRFDKSPDRDKAWTRLAEMGNSIVFGATLSKVAQTSSDGFKAKSGGQQGWLERGTLVWENIETALFELPVNHLSDVIETQDGYHIVRVLERNPGGYVPFTEAQTEIREKLLKEKKSAQMREYISTVQKKIPFEIYEPDSQKLMDQKLAASNQE